MSVRKSLFLFLGALVLFGAAAFARPQTEDKPATTDDEMTTEEIVIEIEE